uniref:Response regulator transcription factor n=1 Tax=Rhodothermus marinus TaxID=29549 RepID=A0A7V2B2R1_RHOMR
MSVPQVANGQRWLMLLLDADAALHPFIQAALRRAPYAALRQLECHATTSVQEAQQLLSQYRYQLALISLESVGHPTLPLLENAVLTRQLVREATSEHPPIVAMTSVGSQAERAQILELGFSGYLCKPFTLGTLFESLAAALDLA